MKEAGPGLHRIVPGPAFLFILLGATAAPSSPSRQESSSQEEPLRFRAQVQAVLLQVSVKDTAGLPVRGLPQSAFTVRDEGQDRPLVYFDERSEPLSIVLALDVSSSMSGERLEEAKRAARAFIENVAAAELALVSFDDETRVEVPWTERPEELGLALDRLTARGGTALYQAIDRGLDLLQQARYRRTALLLLSDGKEEDSDVSFSDLHRRVEVSQSPIYTIGFYTEEERQRFKPEQKYYKKPAFDVNLNPAWVLAELARSSGGLALLPASADELMPAFLAFASELQHQYLLGFEPALAETEDEGFRRIEVVVRSSEHPKPLQVRTRSGYRLAAPRATSP